MEELKLIITFFQSLGVTGLLIILAIPHLRKKIFGMNGTDKKIDALNQHYNHETTKLLTEIRDDIKEIRHKQCEWDRYGIKTLE